MSSNCPAKWKIKKFFHSNSSVYDSVNMTAVKRNAKLAWHGLKLASKNVERLLDGTPLKIPVGVINSLIGLVDTIIENNDSMAMVLLQVGQRLEIVNMNIEHMRRPARIESSCQRFIKTLQDTEDELKKMQEQGKLKRMLESNEHLQQLKDIFRRVDEATKTFQLDLTLATAREVKGIVESTEILRLQHLKPCQEARYADVARQPCVEGTREEIIKSIMTWSRDDSPDCPPIYWLSGMAGTGKSTIAYTICKELYDGGDKSGRLGASFFCSRQIEAARLRKNVIPTIVHDLAHSFPDFGRALLASKFDAQRPPLRDHIPSLLSDPWRSVTANQALPPLVVVIDALDELEGKDGSFFLEQLIKEVSLHENGFRGLKFFVTSRQDPRIVKICDSIDSRAVCRLEEVPSAVIENDIHLYLCTALPALNPSILRTLAQHASGLFIYAATAVRFIIPPSQHDEPTLKKQTERLSLLLRAWPERAECGVDGLLVDRLYEEVLSLWLFPKSKMERRIARAVLQTVICTEEPILVTDIPQLLVSEFYVEEMEASHLILSLHAVLYVFENHIYSYHKSFIDFIYSSTRFMNQDLATLLCPTPERQLCLTTSCFRVMSSLRFNICDLPSSYLDDSEVDDLLTRIDENISHALRYACRHWAKHMSKAPSDERVVEIMKVTYQTWMECQLLFWIEVMNLLNVVRECHPLLFTARQWLGKNITLELEQKKDLIAAENLITSFGSTAIAASTPHLYVSALASYPQESNLISRWRHKFPKIPTVTATLNEDPPLASLSLSDKCDISDWLFLPDGIHIAGTEGGKVFLWDISAGQFREIAIVLAERICLSASPNTKHIVGCDGETVWIWEVPTGKELHRMEGDTQVNSLSISTDGTRIAIVYPHSVHLWDTSTWNKLHWEGVDDNTVTSACFSPDGAYIALGSWRSIRIWDVSHGNELHKLDVACDVPRQLFPCSDDDVVSLAFSPDGKRVLSGSKNSVQMWDMLSGIEIYRLDEREIISVHLSPDGTYIASWSGEQMTLANSVQIWNASNGNKLHSLGPTCYLSADCFSSDVTQVLSSTDTDIIIWDLSSGKEFHRLVEQDKIHAASFSPDGTRILSDTYKCLTIWGVPTKNDKQWCQLAGSNTEVRSTHFSPDGKQIATFSIDGTLCILDATTIKETHRLETDFRNVEGACFTADGTRIIWAYGVGYWQCDTLTGKLLEVNEWDAASVKLFDCTTRSGALPLCGKEHHDNPLRFVAVRSDCSHFTCHGMGSLKEANNLSFSPNGLWSVTGSEDTTVRIWDTSTGNELKRLEAHSGRVNSVCFSPDGKQVVSGSKDRTTRIWDVPEMQECQCHGISTGTSVDLLPDRMCLDSCPFYHSRTATWSFLDSDTMRTDWSVDSNGWIKSSDGKRYFWFSKKMHSYLNRPDSVSISAMGSVEVDFSTGRYGQRWAECYEP